MVRTAGSRSWTVVLGLCLLALARPGCDPVDGGDDEPPVIAATQAEVLGSVYPQVLAPALAEAGAAADALVLAIEAWSEDPAAQPAAQEAWRAAMGAWERVEVMQVGPIGSSLSAVGGQDLRDQIYSWPTVNPCAVDQQTVAAAWDDPDFFATHLVNVYGLDALETLLFSPAGENACPSQVDINASGSWDALGPDGVQANRADYAAAVARGVAERIGAADAAWVAYAGEFEAGGQDSLNALFEALYYLELRTKDDKLGGPIGLHDCGATSCLSFVETPLAGGSNDWIVENLVGFRALFTGGAGAGLDDLLAAVDAADLADRTLAAIDAADAAAAALAGPVTAEATPEAVALHEALTAVGTILESEVAPTLVLQIPTEAAGDND